MRAATFAVLCLTAFLISGCATNPYRQFYVSTVDARAASSLIPTDGAASVYAGGEESDDQLRMFEAGCYLIGYASFVGPQQDQGLLRTRARELKAAYVLVYDKNPQTTTETVPALPVPDLSFLSPQLQPRQTTSTTGTVTGPGGSFDFHATSTTILPPPPKPAPKMVTYTTTRSEQIATFWVKTKPARLGIWARDFTADERAARGTNKGIAVVAIRKDCPAYDANVLHSDILVRLGDVPLTRTDDLYAALDKYQGTETELLVIRNGKERTIRVKLNR